jgi:hypothetical protein
MDIFWGDCVYLQYLQAIMDVFFLSFDYNNDIYVENNGKGWEYILCIFASSVGMSHCLDTFIVTNNMTFYYVQFYVLLLHKNT